MSWLRRIVYEDLLQRAQSHRFMLLFLPTLTASVALVAAGTLLFHIAGATSRLDALKQAETHAIDIRSDALAEVVDETVYDLSFLARLSELTPFLSETEERSYELQTELRAFLETRATYTRVSVLSSDGSVLLDVEWADESVVVTDRLPDAQEFVVQEDSEHLTGSEISVSPVAPSNDSTSTRLALIRFSIPLEVADRRIGYLLVDVTSTAVLDTFSTAHAEEESVTLLLDPAGRVLFTSEQERVLPETDTFTTRYSAEWQQVSVLSDGQFETDNGLFTFGTVHVADSATQAKRDIEAITSAVDPAPTPVAQDAYYWKSISWVAPSSLRSLRNADLLPITGWGIVAALLLGVVSWILAKWLTRRMTLAEKAVQHSKALHSTLAKYMSPEICERVLGNPTHNGGLGGDSQDVVVLFADVRGFTRFAEAHDPQYVVSVLNRTLTGLTVALRAHRGILDKFLGDGLLAFFEPTNEDLMDPAKRALDAAVSMHKAFFNLWRDVSDPELHALGLGIGISAGTVVVGNIGSSSSMDYTVVGDPVNVAHRLQAAAGPGEIILSDAAYARLPSDIDAEVLHSFKLRGRRGTIDAYRLSLLDENHPS